jgi:hypothetical protein
MVVIDIEIEILSTIIYWLLGINLILTTIILLIVVHFIVTRLAKLERRLYSAAFFSLISLVSIGISLLTIIG